MKVYQILGIIALLTLVIVLPLYAQREPARLEIARSDLEATYVQDAAHLYLDNCSLCHGLDGKGLGSMPPLNDPTLTQQNKSAIYNTIAHSPHGSAMAAWHVEEGGVLNSYQVESLVTLISTGEDAWNTVVAIAEETGVTLDEENMLSTTQIENLAMTSDEGNPHECRACHEEPEVHADRFGANCAYCHNLMAWKPALLSRHVFRLSHGGAGSITCQTCHVESYQAVSCYGCHGDHQEEEMLTLHSDLGIVEDISQCSLCHPTGDAGEAQAMLDAAVSNGD